MTGNLFSTFETGPERLVHIGRLIYFTGFFRMRCGYSAFEIAEWLGLLYINPLMYELWKPWSRFFSEVFLFFSGHGEKNSFFFPKNMIFFFFCIKLQTCAWVLNIKHCDLFSSCPLHWPLCSRGLNYMAIHYTHLGAILPWSNLGLRTLLKGPTTEPILWWIMSHTLVNALQAAYPRTPLEYRMSATREGKTGTPPILLSCVSKSKIRVLRALTLNIWSPLVRRGCTSPFYVKSP